MGGPGLVERDEALALVLGVIGVAPDDGGQVVLVHGEAGVGKTALVRAARAAVPHLEVLVGRCDALSTPRPLGPLRDLAADAGPPLSDALAQERAPHEVFAATLAHLRTPRVVVVEDAHWADGATLDLVRYLGRRIQTTPSVLVLTYRDGEVGATHPLQDVIGDLVRTGATTRVALSPLSPRGVGALIGELPIDPVDLHAKTGGNPFFVTEVLAQPDRPVPDNVRDAVLGRTVGLAGPARVALQLVSCVPTGLDRDDVRALGLGDDVLDELVRRDLLVHEHGRVRFRHELGRLTVEASMGDGDRRARHATLLAALEPRADHALLVHLADGAGLPDAVAAHAPQAAAEAARAGARRQSAAFIEAALAVAPIEDRAELLEALSYERYHVDETPAAVDAMAEALELRRAQGATARVAADLRWLSRFEWFCADRASAEVHAAEAVQVAETSGDPLELGFAQGQRATISMTLGAPGPAIEWGTAALEVAERFDDDELRATMLTTVGMANLMTGDERGIDRIRDSARVAARCGLDEHGARAWNNLSFFLVEGRRFPEATEALELGLRFTSERDMDTFHLYSLGTRARMRVLQGQWTAAWDDATAVLRSDPAPLNAMWPLWVRGVLGVRRGDPDPVQPLEEAWKIALGFAEAYRLVPIAAALAEHEWLTGEAVGAGARLEHLATRLVGSVGRWQSGETADWLRRLGLPVPDGLDVSGTGYELDPVRDPERAAQGWQAHGLPYEAVLALAGSDETDHLTEALRRCDDLGATATAMWLRRRLRERGVAVVSGPRATTRANPAGLTARQVDVLRLLAEHLTNAEIAERLYISEKTAGHHVSAILAKLHVGSRRDAARLAGSLGLVTGAGAGPGADAGPGGDLDG